MDIDLAKIRERRDRMTDRILVGLKERSAYKLSSEVFTSEFYEGMSWFQYRLLKEQSLDAEFGRYDFEEQQPIFFSMAELEKPKLRRTHPHLGLLKSRIDIGSKVLEIYRSVLKQLCRAGEDTSNYGEIAKLDVDNVLVLNERTLSIGEQVAEAKLHEYPSIMFLDPEAIREKLRVPAIEQAVIDNAMGLASRIYQIGNVESVRKFFREIIDLTLEVETAYVLEAKKQKEKEPREPIGFGQVAPTKVEAPFSTSSRGWHG